MATAATETVLTNISEMIDLAIGTPEVGVVDFCMLQTVLHCLAQQLRVLDKNVELRGPMAALPVGRQVDNAHTVAVSEFVVDTGAPGKYELTTLPPTSDQESVLVVERRRRNDPPLYPTTAGTGSKQPTGGQRSRDRSGSPSAASRVSTPGAATPAATAAAAAASAGTAPATAGPGHAVPTPVPVAAPATPATAGATTDTSPHLSRTTPSSPPHRPSLEKLSLVTLSKFNLLESTVADLRERVYGTSPKNEAILQEVRSQSNLKAITDMWTNMNVSSRLDAAEEGIKKLSSLIEDLIGETTEMQKKIGSQPTPTAGKRSETGTALPKAIPSGHGVKPTPSQPTPGQPAATQPSPDHAAPAQTTPGQTIPGQPAPGQPAPGQLPPGQQAPGQLAPDQLAPGQLAPTEPVPYYPSPSMIAQWPSYDDDKFASKDELLQLLAHVQSMKSDLNRLTKAFSDAMKDVNPSFVAPAPTPPSKIELVARPPPPLPTPTPASAPVSAPAPTDSGGTRSLPAGYMGTVQAPHAGQDQAGYTAQIDGRFLEKLAQLERDLTRCCDSIKMTEATVKDQLSSFQDQLEEIEKNNLQAGLGAGNLSPGLVKDLQGLMKLFETVQNMQTQLKQVHETALNLAAEKEDRQNHIDENMPRDTKQKTEIGVHIEEQMRIALNMIVEGQIIRAVSKTNTMTIQKLAKVLVAKGQKQVSKALLEQIELLKVIKLDREDMVEALADKADLRMLARKVSHDQFENACDDLSKGLEHALGKLNVQESLWQQALDDIQREIEQKLDKMELSPVKDFFNSKLKQLQENLKAMAALRREAEAAGTKRRLLRDVNCISCDAKAIMAMDPTPPLPAKPLPANLSMKPYLSYELDAIRKNQASSLPQRNMHDWEHVQQQMQPTKPHKVRSETDKHLCNRYCGGSHTVTTPAQRVARLGHFIKQWGPEVLPLSSGFAAGDDGRLYKISTSEAANVGPGGALEGTAVCTPKSPAKKPAPPAGPKPIVITAECRCLDPTADLPISVPENSPKKN